MLENSLSHGLHRGQFEVVEVMSQNQFKTKSTNLNTQDVNEMTHFHLA